MWQLRKLGTLRYLRMREEMGGHRSRGIRVHVQGMHRSGGFGKISVRTEADDGRH